MTNIFDTAKTPQSTSTLDKDDLAGPNIAAYKNVANAIFAQCIV